MNDPDAELMIRFQEGDTNAFQQLYERYKTKMINYCYRFIGRQAVAEELAQEVLIRVYRAAAAYRPEARFSTWIFKIATNVCLKEVRKKEYRAHHVSLEAPRGENGEQPLDPPDIRTQPPDRLLENRERMDRIHRALNTLPPRQKAALLLSTFERFSYAEIAGQIGRTESSVKSLIYRARRQLAAVLIDK